uniref:Uncharacterized protein n=1 Tax=Macaca fascicularis TaxID=9541 RepID=A0A7N9CMY0_MACFA
MPEKWRTGACTTHTKKYNLELILKLVTVRADKQIKTNEILEKWNPKPLKVPLSPSSAFFYYFVFLSLLSSFLVVQIKIMISTQPKTCRGKCLLNKKTGFFIYKTFLLFV